MTRREIYLRMLRGKSVFTTGEVAKIVEVAPRTVSKWFDTGRLKGYRIPGSLDRRIPKDQLYRFLKENHMDDFIRMFDNSELYSILIVGMLDGEVSKLKTLFDEEEYKFEFTQTAFECGIKIGQDLPDLILIDFSLGRSEAIKLQMTVAQKVVELEGIWKPVVIGIENEDGHQNGDLGNFDMVFYRPYDNSNLLHYIDVISFDIRNADSFSGESEKELRTPSV